MSTGRTPTAADKTRQNPGSREVVSVLSIVGRTRCVACVAGQCDRCNGQLGRTGIPCVCSHNPADYEPETLR
jgi:hypothetical protein